MSIFRIISSPLAATDFRNTYIHPVFGTRKLYTLVEEGFSSSGLCIPKEVIHVIFEYLRNLWLQMPLPSIRFDPLYYSHSASMGVNQEGELEMITYHASKRRGRAADLISITSIEKGRIRVLTRQKSLRADASVISVIRIEEGFLILTYTYGIFRRIAVQREREEGDRVVPLAGNIPDLNYTQPQSRMLPYYDWVDRSLLYTDHGLYIGGAYEEPKITVDQQHLVVFNLPLNTLDIWDIPTQLKIATWKTQESFYTDVRISNSTLVLLDHQRKATVFSFSTTVRQLMKQI